ncbi:hypothetical protein Poli38472_006581 [Pythium oligandrum]|uniref:Acid phosphatase n=1 Tax=Pythium oligandrum TaxID=41045 RepID=A0A8K1C4U9_PYTOL|nr:hypothetical protein Poli38472_006581 [Pythium oligandrum]|eukprot:TMW56571.1 hypothetical protein Poli38472_006581 [Pythium oligandrum]
MRLTYVASFAAVLVGSAAATLRQVVVVSRHGVRGPYGMGADTPSEELIKKYVRNPAIDLPLSAKAWGTAETEDPSEIVSPKLTKHGYRVVERMGEYFRQHLYRDFLDDTTCPQAYAYADANQRDNLTAEALLGGSFPACKEIVPTTEGTRLLFEQGQDPTATCPVCSRTVYEGIAGAPDCRYLIQESREEIEELNSILDCCAPAACVSEGGNDTNASTCSFFDIPTTWNGAFYQPWKDPLSSADYFSEFLLLQALNNMTLPAELPFEKILSLSKIHEAHMDLVTNEVNSANFGATLLAHMTASFEQTATEKAIPLPDGEGPTLTQSLDNRFLLYTAHDINILYLRNLLRLQWLTDGWHPHQATLGGMLIFELHTSTDESPELKVARKLKAGVKQEDYYVKAYFVTASPQQMRNEEVLSASNPPYVVPVMIPLCSDDVILPNGTIEVRCPFKTFKSLIGRTLKKECVADTLRPFVKSLSDNGSDPSDNSGGVIHLSTLLWVVFGVLIASFLVIVGRHFLIRRRHPAGVQKAEYGTVPQVSSE